VKISPVGAVMPLDLLTLLSQPLIAFTIELDNEYEHRAIHSMTIRRPEVGSRSGPWLTSFAMYSNCLQFLGEAPIAVRDLQRLARTSTNLDGMRRWGYIRLSPPPGKPNSRHPNEHWLIEPTTAGRLAQETWRPLPELLEQRWRERFGGKEITSLRSLLLAASGRSDVAYPDFLPILGYGLFTRGRGLVEERSMPPVSDAPLEAGSPFTALLSRLLCSFAYDFERESTISLAISANLLRILDTTGIRNRDLPQRTGLSKESIAMAMGILEKSGMADIGNGKGRTVRLTRSGLAAKEAALHLIAEIEERWIRHLGQSVMRQLRESLASLVEGSGGLPSRLLQAIDPYPDNWRAAVPRPQTLPHFPMVLHRGGYPDGS
jgi:hypothetical protein